MCKHSTGYRNWLLPIVLLLLVHGNLQAASYYVSKGQTTLAFSPQFFNLLPALGATLTRINPGTVQGTLNKQDLRATFPVTSGVLDDINSIAEIQHGGGLSLSVAGNVQAQLTAMTLQFDLPTAPGNRVISALVTVNGSIAGRFPVFNLVAGGLGGTVQGGKLKLKNIPVTLTTESADLLNAIFHLPGASGGKFYQGYPAGTVTVKAQPAKIITKLK